MDTQQSASPLGDRRQIEAWIDEAKQGSSAALGHLLQACRLYLLEVARRSTPTPLQAKVSPSDLYQETSLAAHRGVEQFRGAQLEEFLAWVRAIMLCTVANARRHYQDIAKRDVAREVSLNGAANIGESLQASQLSPRSLLMGDEERQQVEAALARLSDDHHRVILLRGRERLPFAEIGERMGRSADAARKLWLRAVEQLECECDDGQG